MTAVPHESIERLLLGLEARLNRLPEGSLDPMLLVIEQPEPNDLGLRRAFPLHEPFDAFLAFTAEQFLTHSELPAALLRASRGFSGMALACDAWFKSSPDPEELQKVQDSGTSLSELDGVESMRLVIAVDLFGRVYHIARIEGESVQVAQGTTAGGGLAYGGTVVQSLHAMTLAVARQMDNPEALDALEFLFIESADEVLDRQARQQKRTRSGDPQ